MNHPFYQFDSSLLKQVKLVDEKISPALDTIEALHFYNSAKVLSAFANQKVSESHLIGTTGYGYGDRGRDALDAVYAEVFGTEDALVRHNFVSGTHALSTMLFGVLRPGDVMLSITGKPYDTLEEVIGLSGTGQGSLRDFGIHYREVALTEEGALDTEKILDSLSNVKLVYLQRSRGYTLRPSITIDKMKALFTEIKKKNPEILIAVDNCYGEFSEKQEPTQVGADLIAGSLIKNPGGGIARTGGYIAGKKDLVELCSYRLTTVGTGKEVGPSLEENDRMFQGFFFAPSVVSSAIKTSIFAAALFSAYGYEVTPSFDEKRTDIIQAIKLGSREKIIAFCEGIQKGAPIDSFVAPVPDAMPGYSSEIIMAAGAFHMGASIELSADAPLRPPYAVWLQGGLTYPTGKIGVMLAAQSMLDKNLL